MKTSGAGSKFWSGQRAKVTHQLMELYRHRSTWGRKESWGCPSHKLQGGANVDTSLLLNS